MIFRRFSQNSEKPQLASPFFLILAIPLCCITETIVQSKHNNTFSNVKFAACFDYKQLYQAAISVHGHVLKCLPNGPPRSKYSPQHHVPKHPWQLPFLPQCQRPSFTPICRLH